MKLILLLLMSTCITGVVVSKYYRDKGYEEGRAEVYKVYALGIGRTEGTNQVYLQGDPGKNLPDIRVYFGLFKEPIILNGKVIAFDEDEGPPPRDGSKVVTATIQKAGPPVVPVKTLLWTPKYPPGSKVPVRSEGGAQKLGRVVIPPIP